MWPQSPGKSPIWSAKIKGYVTTLWQWFFLIVLITTALVFPDGNLLLQHLLLAGILVAFVIFSVSAPPLRVTLPDLLVALLLVSPVFTLRTTIHLYHTGLVCLTQLTFFLYYLMARAFLRRRTLIALALVLPLVFSLLSIWQVTGGFVKVEKLLPTGQDSVAMLHRLTQGRVFATFALPNNFGGYLIILCPLLIGVYLTQPRLKFLAGLGLFFCVFNLLLTRSLGAWLSLVLVLPLLIFQQKSVAVRRWGKIAFLGLLFLALSLAGYRLLRHGAGDLQSSFKLRGLNYRSALKIFRAYKMFGSGAGTFGDIYLQYRQQGANVVRHAHNLPLQFAAEGGMIGLLCFFPFWLYFFSKAPQKEMDIYLYLGGLVFFLHNLVDMDYNIISISLLFWSYLAVLFQGAETFFARRSHIYIVIPALLAVFLIYLNNSWWSAEKMFQKAQNRRHETLIVELTRQALNKNPANPEYNAYLGEWFLARYFSGQRADKQLLHAALHNFSQATKKAPTIPHYYFRLGLAAGVAGDKERARTALLKAMAYSPLDKDYPSLLRKVESLP